MDLRQAIITIDVHLSDKSERLRSAWDTVHAVISTLPQPRQSGQIMKLPDDVLSLIHKSVEIRKSNGDSNFNFIHQEDVFTIAQLAFQRGKECNGAVDHSDNCLRLAGRAALKSAEHRKTVRRKPPVQQAKRAICKSGMPFKNVDLAFVNGDWQDTSL